MILQGDVKDQIKKVKSGSIDCIVTSPPYYQLRDYEHDEQWGSESTPKDYLDKMFNLTQQLNRVLKSTGSLWLNIGDTYDNTSQIGIPERLMIKMIDDGGWILRNRLIWYKVTGMPEPVKNRLTHKYDMIYFFVKSKKYYFDLDNIRVPYQHDQSRKPKYVNDYSLQSTLDGKQIEGNGRDYYVQLINDSNLTETEKSNARIALQRARQTGHNFRLDVRGKTSDEEHQHGRAAQISKDGFAVIWATHKIGPNPGDALYFPYDYNKYAHFAQFPNTLPEFCITASCPPDGTVLDPFAGSGTTLVAAKRLKRKYMGIELNSKYVDMIHERLKETIVQLDA